MVIHSNQSAENDGSLVFVPELEPEARRALQREAARRAGLEVVFRDSLSGARRGPEMVVIPPGMFEMGSTAGEFGHRPEEAPQHYVTLRQGFAIGRYTVTAEEFARFQADTGWRPRSDLVWSRGRKPVINIRIADAKAYAAWLSGQTGRLYRLPTEAEWEYAARAGTRTPFHYGHSISCREAHFNPSFPYEEARQGRRWFLPRCAPVNSAFEVGGKPPNAWGLYDMHGNVWEFTQDPWTSSHFNARRDGKVESTAHGDWIVVKGGSYFDPAVLARSAARRPRLRDELDVNLGLRLVRELDA